MDRVGVRDLKQYASRVLARVKAGETLEVTEHGRPVARLSPLREGNDYDRLLEAGDILPGTQDVLAVPPVAVAPGVRLSDDLASLRDDDWR
ncbi:MAG: type II toxin-antitoxin system prevent-host-death family antitoxin [Actinomycetota bacterium]|jgi:prevent-host-death family protein|nr:type II toxin-antitoxin system prevent-host-death family antitoxin [Actinomycetota bacterium]